MRARDGQWRGLWRSATGTVTCARQPLARLWPDSPNPNLPPPEPLSASGGRTKVPGLGRGVGSNASDDTDDMQQRRNVVEEGGGGGGGIEPCGWTPALRGLVHRAPLKPLVVVRR